ncbi:5-formyltetrahydrofolate cyclo-ligase, mitochondrial [Ziziphus jujuba]|uniref:5-formyltetrahydrofolate cyclo-ligase n=1 Tax=Ziziphus jujuba TaxID=326968 RepID=A0A6P3ZSC5_ZIZJJ|nr:5-formyltetrahydrofolate cyclo-ligase, mitochondrial [Ziziphus jujuba]
MVIKHTYKKEKNKNKKQSMRKYMKQVAVALMTKSTIFAPTLTANSLSLSRPRPPPTFASHSITTMINNQEQQHQLEDANLDAIFKQKKLLRSRVRKQLKAMDPTLRSQEDDEIQRLVLEAPWFKSCQRLCAYITCKALREVDTSKVLYEILANPAKDGHSRKKLYVPRVEDKNSNMRMLNISSLDDLVANSMDILEPAPVDGNGNKREDVMQANDPVDLFLLPGLAFDRSGRRLGRGGGYYDTFLKNYKELAGARNWKQPLLVALSYSIQIVDEGSIPVTQNDIPVDALVSPAGVIPISSAALDRLKD